MTSESDEVQAGIGAIRIGLMLSWRVGGVVSWALLSGVLVGLATEYAPLFGDPSGDRSMGDAVAKALFYGLSMSVFGVIREVHRKRRASEVASDG